MIFEECLAGCLCRLKCKVVYKSGYDDFESVRIPKKSFVEVIKSGESHMSYANVVDLYDEYSDLTEELGSRLNWDNHDQWINGDGSSAILGVKDGKLVVLQCNYDRIHNSVCKWGKEYTVTKEICILDDIISMSFETSSGWKGDCYSERDESNEECARTKRNWLCVWHRSDGSVTICDEMFPFWEHNEIEMLKSITKKGKIDDSEIPCADVSPVGTNIDYVDFTEESEIIEVEGSDEVRRQVNGIWQHKHGNYDYWHPMTRIHKEAKE